MFSSYRYRQPAFLKDPDRPIDHLFRRGDHLRKFVATPHPLVFVRPQSVVGQQVHRWRNLQTGQKADHLRKVVIVIIGAGNQGDANGDRR